MSAVSFLNSPPGLGSNVNFEFEALDDDGLLFTLRNTATDTRLFLIQPTVFFADYAPQVPEDVLTALELPDATAAAIFAVVHPGDDANAATVNLLAPVVLNAQLGRAEQIVLEDDRWPLRAELPTGA